MKYRAEESDYESVIQETKKLAQEQKPFEVKLAKLVFGEYTWRRIMLEVEKGEDILKLYERTKQVMQKWIEGEKSEYYPHLSLFYGEKSKDAEEYTAKAVKEMNLEGSTLLIDRIDMYTLEGSVGEWVHLASIPLGDNLVFRSSLFINNKWVNPVKKQWLPVVNPANRQVFHYFPNGTADDIDAAVKAAKAAFPSWSATDAKTRANYLRAIAAKVSEKRDELARVEVLDNGKPLPEAQMDIDDVAACFEYYANLAIEYEAKQDQPVQTAMQGFSSRFRREPVGVAGLIVPWNYPLLMATWKVAPCLAAGCTAVLKPSELTPLTALELAAICKEVGLPPGVLNVVTGLGPDAGQPLADHPDVEKIAFTGSVPTGSKVMGIASKRIKNGGKSAFIIFEDSNISQAVEWIMFGGQVCSATSRVLVHESIYDQVLKRLTEEISKIKIGDGLEPDTKLGPIVSEGQYNRVLEYIKKGISEGAKLVCGGIPTKPELLKGFFVPPTVFTDLGPWGIENYLEVKQITTYEEDGLGFGWYIKNL